MRHRDTRSLGRSGVEATHTGDARAARESFERIVAAAQADASAGTGFAMSVEASTAARLPGPFGQGARPEAPQSAPIHHQGRPLVRGGRRTRCILVLLAAVKTAPPANQLLSDLRNELGRARGMCRRYAADRLVPAGSVDDSRCRRAATPPNNSGIRSTFASARGVSYEQALFSLFPELAQGSSTKRTDSPGSTRSRTLQWISEQS